MAYQKIVVALSIEPEIFQAVQNQAGTAATEAAIKASLLDHFYQRISPVIEKAFTLLPPVGSKACQHCELHLVHVTELETLPILEDSIAMGLPGIWSQEAQQQAQWLSALFESVAQRIRANHSLMLKSCAEEGQPAQTQELGNAAPRLCSRVLVGEATQELSRYLTRVQADLLLIRFDRATSKQANWLKKLQYCLLGTTESLVAEVNCDVLIVK